MTIPPPKGLLIFNCNTSLSISSKIISLIGAAFPSPLMEIALNLHNLWYENYHAFSLPL